MDGDRLYGLDQLRAAAITGVLFFHYKVYYGIPEWLDGVSSFGWSGVDLFFVLSGFLIANKLLSEIDLTGKITFRGFYLNRLLRIVPAYLVVVAIYFTFPFVQEGRGLQPLWKFLTFTQNIAIDAYANTFSHAWSLCVEQHFYILFPVLLYIVFQKKQTHRTALLFLTLLITGILIRYAIWEISLEPAFGRQKLITSLKTIYYPTYTRIDGLLVGVAIASIFRYNPAVKEKLLEHGNLVLLSSFILLLASYFLFGGSVLSMKFTSFSVTLFGFPLLSIAYGMLVIAALSSNCVLYRIKFKPTLFLAKVSYSIYLLHKITNHLVNTQLTQLARFEDDQLFLISLFAAVMGGSILYFTTEKPFLKLRGYLIQT